MTLDRLTAEEIAERAGTTPEHIALLGKLGILEPEDDGTYPRRDVLRARFVRGLDSMGIDAHAVADALASGDLSLGYVEIGGRRPPRSDRTFTELSEEIGVPFPMLERIYVAFGLPRPTPAEYVREEDLPLMRFIPVLVGGGLNEGDVLRLARVWGDSARRVAQFQSHYLHHSIEEPFRQRGLRDNAASRPRSARSAFGRAGPGKICSAGSTGGIRKCSRPSTCSIMSRPRSRTRGCIGRNLGRSKAACSRTSPVTRG
jgi:hypothetical protein